MLPRAPSLGLTRTMNHRPSPPCQTKRVFECSGFVPSTRLFASPSHQANRWQGLERTRRRSRQDFRTHRSLAVSPGAVRQRSVFRDARTRCSQPWSRGRDLGPPLCLSLIKQESTEAATQSSSTLTTMTLVARTPQPNHAQRSLLSAPQWPDDACILSTSPDSPCCNLVHCLRPRGRQQTKSSFSIYAFWRKCSCFTSPSRPSLSPLQHKYHQHYRKCGRSSTVLYTCSLVETCTRRGLLIQPAYNMWALSKDSDENLKIQSVRSLAGSACGDGLSLGWFMLGSALLDILSQFLESHLVADRHNTHRALQCLDEGIDCSSGTPAGFVSFLNRLLALTGTDQCPHEHRVRSEMWA